MSEWSLLLYYTNPSNNYKFYREDFKFALNYKDEYHFKKIAVTLYLQKFTIIDFYRQ